MKRRRRSAGNGGNGLASSAPAVTLVTGGAGFVGCNLADCLLRQGHHVTILDNLSRPGAEHNLSWLRSRHGDRMGLIVGDVRDRQLLAQAVRQAARVYHFAAQVAVTTSCNDPLTDFDVNARGTLNLLEALRQLPTPPPLVFTSTNKVYGALGDVTLRATGSRYEPEDAEIRSQGIGETRPLDFHSPYGCSKGVADQYVLDFARGFGLRTVVFRMSCIYGGRQFGNEDQGWVAHFLRQAEAGLPITIYGDGRQVRDILHIDDLVRALLMATEHIETLSGRAFNLGGGPANTLSLLELLDHIARVTGRMPNVEFESWRMGDQRYYVSSYARFHDATGWQPQVDVSEGLARLRAWIAVLEGGEASSAAGNRSPSPLFQEVQSPDLRPPQPRIE